MKYFPTYEMDRGRVYKRDNQSRLVLTYKTRIRKNDDKGRMFYFDYVDTFDIALEFYSEYTVSSIGEVFINQAYERYLEQGFEKGMVIDGNQETEKKRANRYNLELLENHVKKTTK